MPHSCTLQPSSKAFLWQRYFINGLEGWGIHEIVFGLVQIIKSVLF